MADNGEQTLDPDILECMQDILRLRQSIANSKSGQMMPEPEIDIRPAIAAVAEKKGEETAMAAQVDVVAVAEPVAVTSQPAAIPQIPQQAEVTPVVVEEPQAVSVPAAVAENPYAVTREEVDALLDTVDVPDEEAAGPDGNGEVAAESALMEAMEAGETPSEEEFEAIVKEADEWIDRVAPEADDQPVMTHPEAAPVPEKHFDEVVSNLQGEPHIAPVDDAPELPAVVAEATQAAEPSHIEVVGEDVKLNIIKELREGAQESEEERGGVPRFDLNESSLGGTLESRRNTGATRKGPGRKEKSEILNPKSETEEEKTETIEEKSEISNFKSEAAEEESQISDVKSEPAEEPAASIEPAVEDTVVEAQAPVVVEVEEPEVSEPEVPVRPMFAMPNVVLPEDTARLERQRRILAGIVARDIETLCGRGRRQRARVIWR